MRGHLMPGPLFCKKNKNRTPPRGTTRARAAAAPCTVGRDERGEARAGNRAPRGAPHGEQAPFRLKTWSKKQPSEA